eukprot:CAMPEP_0195074610 /NCGR_PEP_ID=MMETSP0448-20130528/17681_1 /TAXON_ID=66468 /ORGANISM="Heterocapsa triquestra, Strain CCMP 448" /LENGTH=74 /DNA_ID=CAMNT_0040106887 /DNA_START=58 /DNA_END=279 /DNA_ORIENTATION=-
MPTWRASGRGRTGLLQGAVRRRKAGKRQWARAEQCASSGAPTCCNRGKGLGSMGLVRGFAPAWPQEEARSPSAV